MITVQIFLLVLVLVLQIPAYLAGHFHRRMLNRIYILERFSRNYSSFDIVKATYEFNEGSVFDLDKRAKDV